MPISAAQAKMPIRRFIYLIASDRAVKIGISIDVETRLQYMQVGSPDALKLIDKWPHFDASGVESRVHARLRQYRKKGEWFTCNAETAIKAIEEEIENTLRNPLSRRDNQSNTGQSPK